MKPFRLYFDTSVFNFALADELPKEQEITRHVLDQAGKKICEAFISEVVLREVNRALEQKARRLMEQINICNPAVLQIDSEIQELAQHYIMSDVIPMKYFDDALHIAAASVYNLDAVVSWNFEHIVKLKTKREVTGINSMMGYKEIEVISPWEVML